MNVVLAARDPERGEQAAQELRDEGLDVAYERLDVADSLSVEECARRLADAGTEVDALVNNAGVYPTEGVFSVSEEAADTLVWLATLSEDGPNGGFFRDREPIPW
jgi:NADP-dependent 3-hydroxy acid dehydrogenase YdfG